MPTIELKQHAVFTGNPAIEELLDEQFGRFLDSNGQLIAALNIKKPDGTIPPDDWAPAIFLPSTGLHQFDVLCYVSETMENLPPYIYEEYGLPRTTKHALDTLLVGTLADIVDFCQLLCDLSGLTCVISDAEGENDEDTSHENIQLRPRHAPVSDFASLLIDDPEF